MNIVVLDGYTLNPGDLRWDALTALGPCTVYDRTSPQEILSRAAGADIILTNKTPLPHEIIASLPHLRYVGVLATGYNIVDVAAATSRGITVANVPTYGTMSVAQVVFAHLFNLTHAVGRHADEVRAGRWSQGSDFCFWDFPLIEVSTLTMGIVGLGRIGSATARAAIAFGMNVIAFDRAALAEAPADVRMVSLNELFVASDVVSLHCPLTPETHRLVNKDRLATMKRSAYLINTSRGPLIDDEALADALNNVRIAGAGLDVLTVEPPPPNHPLLGAKNCFITPHFAWATTAARTRLMTEAVENVRAFLRGERRNVVNA